MTKKVPEGVEVFSMVSLLTCNFLLLNFNVAIRNVLPPLLTLNVVNFKTHSQ